SQLRQHRCVLAKANETLMALLCHVGIQSTIRCARRSACGSSSSICPCPVASQKCACCNPFAVALAVANEMRRSSVPEKHIAGHRIRSTSRAVVVPESNIQKNNSKRARPDSGPNRSNMDWRIEGGMQFKELAAAISKLG